MQTEIYARQVRLARPANWLCKTRKLSSPGETSSPGELAKRKASNLNSLGEH